MADALHTLVPLFAFMLIPVWIPLIAIVGGALLDLARPRTDHPILAESARRREAARVSPATPALQPAT